MKKFRVRDYEIKSDKLCPGASVRLALLADLHGLEFGRENKRLFSALEQRRPDAVLLAGDMVVRKDPEGLPGIARFIGRLAARFPVYYALGNHECRMLLNPEQSSAYLKYEETLKKRGVHILHNENSDMEIQNSRFRFYGLEIPMEYYAKPRSPRLTAEKVRELVGFPDPDSVCVLLAHNPKYGKAYFSWGPM
ncbi:MAG: metallophosphoesterase [Clostridiales bacterium]|nr:metallophosphoesterase [Clostridiales bacterium]